jgi:hypothetical protein
MSNTYNIPTTDAAFNAKQQLVVTKVIARSSDWKINDGYLNSTVIPAKNLWETKYAAWQQLASRTPIVTAQKNDAKAAYLAVFRPLVAQLLSNPFVTQQDLDSMELQRSGGSHTPVPVPVSFPEAKADSSVPRRVTLNFVDSVTGKRAKPHGVAGAVVRYGVLPTPPIDVNELTNTVLDTVSPCHLDFTEAQRGSRVYYCLAWQNTRGEKGPWSQIEMAIIP